jgi:hypothetical protein
VELMGWVIFEVFLAFGLAIFIVWWTLPSAKKRRQRKAETAKRESVSGGDQSK